MVLGQVLQAPEWLRDRVEARLDRVMGGFQIEFGEVYVVIHKGWRPRISLQDVVLKDETGGVVARLADAEASLAMRPLLQGKVQPKRIALSGAFAKLRRDADGVLSLSFGDAAAPVEQAPTMHQLVEQLDNVFLQPNFAALSSVELDAITLSYEDLRKGRVWSLDGGQVQVTRGSEDLRIATSFSLLSGRDVASLVEANYSSTLGSPEASFGISISDLEAEDIAAQSPALAWMQVLRAPISGALRGGIDDTAQIGPVSATLQIGAGVVQPNPSTKPVPFSGARTYFTYVPAEQKLQFDEISVDSAWGSAVAEGTAYLEGVEDGVLRDLVAQLQLNDLRTNPQDLYAEPIAIERANVDLKMQLEPFRLQLGQISVHHQDRILRASGDLTAPSDGWKLALDAHLNQITPAQVLAYWPETVADKPREWVQKNLTAAVFRDLDLAFRLQPGAPPDLYADFNFSDATIRYAKTLPPLIRTAGMASLDRRRFTVTASEGVILTDTGDEIDASGTSFIIPDIGIRKSAPGIARIIGSGSVASMLSLLNRPPLRLLDKANLPVELAKGAVDLSGSLALPLRDGVKIKDMEFHLSGDIRNMQSDRLVPDMQVSAETLSISGDQTGVTISGNGLFGSVPMQALWRQPIAKGPEARSTLTGSVELSPTLLQELKTGLPKGMVTGNGRADVTVGIGGGAPITLSARSDLEGVTLSLPELGWSKPASRTGRFEMEATLGQGGSVDRIEVEGAGLRARGAISFNDDRQMERARFSSFELGNWIAVPLELVGRGSQAPDINVLGGTVDLGRASFGSSSAGSQSSGRGPRINVRLDRLQVSQSIALTGMQGSFDSTGGLSGNFTGRINGQAPIEGQMLRRGARSGFFLQSADAGSVFRSAGILDQARGGKMQLSLEPVGEPGTYDARLKVTNTRVQDAPAMAAVLNAVSLVGLLDEMSGQGIQFSDIESRMRITPTSVTILEGSAVGPSIGVSVNGTVNTARGTLDLRGVVSPIYMLNAIGSVLTRKGEGLIGFNYTLTGAMKAPQVFVNPLSGLAPGFLRDIIREPAPVVPSADGTPQQPEPPTSHIRDYDDAGGDR